MPMDVRDNPASYGDGSGLVSRPRSKRARRRQHEEQKRREAKKAAQEAQAEKMVAAYRSKYAFPFRLHGVNEDGIAAFFGRVFGGESNE